MNQKIKINWEGSLFVHHSLGMVNREILCELINHPEFELRIIPYEPDQFTPCFDSKFFHLHQIAQMPPHDAPDITVKHRWPPDFSSPINGRFVLFQPWEYGSLPVSWLTEISKYIDEVWVYTNFLKECYIGSGLPDLQVKVIPLGIDISLFNPSKPPLQQIKGIAEGKYSFLFNGGVTLRKGTDILVNAYLNEFQRNEPVCLIIKDSNAYGKGLAEKVRLLSQRTDIAEIIYLCENISHDDLAGLYTACDCYVHPYRAEGYGLPIAEALACGKPVIVTGDGACMDFVKPGMGYFINCAIEKMKEKIVDGIQTVDYPFWLVPDTIHLQKTLRYVYENQQEAKTLGISSGINFSLSNTWSNSAKIVSQRILNLVSGNTNQDEKELMTTKAISLLESGDYSKATCLLNFILKKYGESSVVYEAIGLALYQLNNYHESFEFFRNANRLRPDVPDIILNWAESARKSGRFNEITVPLKNVITFHPENPELIKLATELRINF